MHFNVALEKQQHYWVVPNHYPKQKANCPPAAIDLIHPRSKTTQTGRCYSSQSIGPSRPETNTCLFGADPNGPPSCALCPPSLTRFSKKWPCFHRIGRVVFGKHTHQIPKKIIYSSRKTTDILSLVLLRHTPCFWIVVDIVGISPKDLKLWYPTTTTHNSVSNTQIVATFATFWNPCLKLHLLETHPLPLLPPYAYVKLAQATCRRFPSLPATLRSKGPLRLR